MPVPPLGWVKRSLFVFVCCVISPRPGQLCYVAPQSPGVCTSGRLLGPPVGRCTRTPFVGAVRLREEREGRTFNDRPPKLGARQHRKTLTQKRTAPSCPPGFLPDLPGAARLSSPGHTRDARLGPGSGNRAPQHTPKHTPKDCTEAATERTSYGPSTFQPRARRWSAGNPGNPGRLSACPSFPIDASFSAPSGYFAHLHRTEPSPAEWLHAAIWHGRSPRSVRSWPMHCL